MSYVHFGPHFIDFDGKAQVSLQRTLRIPETGEWPLPPGLGTFPMRPAGDNKAYIPMYVREAMWLHFSSTEPIALQVGVGGVCALTGAPLANDLTSDPQNYVVLPEQPWLDGINSGAGTISQFVAVPHGLGATVESQLTGQERVGGLQLVAWRLTDAAWQVWRQAKDNEPPLEVEGAFDAAPPTMGIGAGGTMRQEIFDDPRPRDDWADAPFADADIQLVPAAAWRELTGEDPPPSPVNIDAYISARLPFFEYYAADMSDIEASEALAKVRRTGEWFGDVGDQPPPPSS